MAASFVRVESGRIFRMSNVPGSSDWLLELVDGRWVKPSGPVYGEWLMDGTPLSEEDVANLVKSGT